MSAYWAAWALTGLSLAFSLTGNGAAGLFLAFVAVAVTVGWRLNQTPAHRDSRRRNGRR